MYRDTDTNEFTRLLEMILAAQEFGLDQAEACALAEEALAQEDRSTESVDRVAGALAERLMEKARTTTRRASLGR